MQILNHWDKGRLARHIKENDREIKHNENKLNALFFFVVFFFSLFKGIL
jgi:gamma-glutamyl-gamma-aminobutyrate hydrolase PuuD